MLVTFGLDRLEASLVDGETVSDGVAAALDRAKADCAKPALPPARITGRSDPFSRVIDHFDHEETAYVPYRGRPDGPAMAESAPRSPSRIYVHRPANPEFRATWHADRV